MRGAQQQQRPVYDGDWRRGGGGGSGSDGRCARDRGTPVAGYRPHHRRRHDAPSPLEQCWMLVDDARRDGLPVVGRACCCCRCDCYWRRRWRWRRVLSPSCLVPVFICFFREVFGSVFCLTRHVCTYQLTFCRSIGMLFLRAFGVEPSRSVVLSNNCCAGILFMLLSL